MAEWMEDQLDNLATPLPTVVMAGAMSRWNGCTIQVWRARRHGVQPSDVIVAGDRALTAR